MHTLRMTIKQKLVDPDRLKKSTERSVTLAPTDGRQGAHTGVCQHH